MNGHYLNTMNLNPGSYKYVISVEAMTFDNIKDRYYVCVWDEPSTVFLTFSGCVHNAYVFDTKEEAKSWWKNNKIDLFRESCNPNEIHIETVKIHKISIDEGEKL